MTEPRILYVVGCGHSGSTLLDMLVSTHSRIFSAGEAKMFRRSPETVCTCGAERWYSCPFWKRVDERMRADGEPGLGHESIEHGDPEVFSAYNRRFFRAISAESGCDVVLDSSKDFSRLKSFLNSDLHVEVIHLIRDPRGVVFSGLRKGRPIRGVSKKYVRTHVSAARALLDVPHIEVRYEDLAREPEREVARILEHLGLEFEPDQLAGWRRIERHNFGGNRMRLDDTETIRLDEAWRTEFSAWQRFSIWMRTLPARARSRLGLAFMHRLFG